MNLNNDKPNFLDRNTILAFVLIMGFWFAWAKYQERNAPPAPTTAQQTENNAAHTQTGANPGPPAIPPVAGTDAPAPSTAPVDEKLTTFANDRWSFELSSKGMGVRNVDIKEHKTRDGKPIILGAVTSNYPFATQIAGTGEAVDFQIEQTAPDTFVGRANAGGVQIEKTLKVDSSTYSIQSDVKVSNYPAGFGGVATVLNDVLQEAKSGSFLAPSYEHQDWYIRHDDTKIRSTIHKADGLTTNANNVSLAALSAHYFALAVVDKSAAAPRFESRIPANSATAPGLLIYAPPAQGTSYEVKSIAYAGPKSFDLLSKIDPNLPRVIDYGIFAFLARPILWLLKFLFSVIGNWGWAIVALTIIVRLIVLPFNVYSFKSMKAMQKIQPEMNRIRERYKDKPADQRLQMNQEIMDLMKRSKANPLGGCLPMLLQLPVFIALYAVLGMSVELYRAPFILWIHDLSVKDPFFVLPVLMGITMFVQQKITPNTMPPEQAKILMWMPVIFTFFMVSLPSGLTLYIFVSTLFGIIQQWFFMRDKSSVKTVKEAKA